MTYAGFLVLFLVVPVAVSLAWLRGAGRRRRRALVPLLVIVYATTTPWDHVAVARGYWEFDPALISGLRLWRLPIEEYAFFGLQTLLTGLWAARALARRVDGAG